MFSNRTTWNLRANRVAERLESMRAAGAPILDLTESNPTRCGLGWPPADIAALLSDPRAADYRPAPQGLPEGRSAVCRYLALRGAAVSAERILLTASTSEAYAMLMKLLCDPGDAWLVPAPSYPLLDLLAQLEAVELNRYPLRYDGEWHIDRDELERAVSPRTRALVAVSPGNPTGAVVSTDELAFLADLCARRGLALVADEVFADTALGPVPSAAGVSGCLAFHLAGLSKTCGLPQMKVGWIAAAGPEDRVRAALSRLEVIADTFLSVSAPAQLALSSLLDRREEFLGRLRRRLSGNRAALEGAVPAGAPWGPLRGAGGWSAVIRLGERADEEALCLALLDAGVAVQPGFFYDFERNGHLVLSLLPEPAAFREAVLRLGRVLEGPFS